MAKGKEIKNAELRARKGPFTLKEISELVGVHYSTLSLWFMSDMDEVQMIRVTRAIEILEKRREAKFAEKYGNQ